MHATDDWSLIHETPALLGVVKPAGLLSVPGRGASKADCLIARVQRRFPEARIVHRLDQATSGVMVLARTADAHRDLGWQFERRGVSKRYVAIVTGHLAGHPTRHPTDDLAGHPAGHPTGPVAGHLAADEGEIDLPLRKALADGPRHVVDPIHGKPAVTRWRVVERTTLGRLRDAIAARGLAAGSPIASSADPASPITRLHLVPLTGRSHQLRVHLRHLGHAVLGDEFYASPEVLALASRLMLHAEALTVRDPVDGRAIDLRADAGW